MNLLIGLFIGVIIGFGGGLILSNWIIDDYATENGRLRAKVKRLERVEAEHNDEFIV